MAKTSIYCNPPLSQQQADDQWMVRSIKRFLIAKGTVSNGFQICQRPATSYLDRKVVSYVSHGKPMK
eukprot:6191303-Prorocentrum_lima.AAC.1